MINVLIVEDQLLIREILEKYVMEDKNCRISASIANAGLAETVCRQSQIDLVLMDVCTQGGESGFDATKKIKAVSPGTKVIIITGMLDCTYIDRAREAGAESLWFKDTGGSEMMEIIHRTLQGESVFPDKTPEVVVGDIPSYEFTKAELKVLRLLVEGLTYKEMSDKLGVSVDTVKAHVSSMLSKTGFASKTKLAAVAAGSRLIVNDY